MLSRAVTSSARPSRTCSSYFAIRHAFDDHSRAEYVRAYDADADAIRRRESVLEAIEAEADIDAVVARIDATGDEEPTGSHAEP